MIIVTGPLLTKDTCISAPKSPEKTSLEIDSDKSFLNFSEILNKYSNLNFMSNPNYRFNSKI